MPGRMRNWVGSGQRYKGPRSVKSSEPTFKSQLLPRPVWEITLDEWKTLDHVVTRSGPDMHYWPHDGSRVLWPGTNSKKKVIAAQHRYEIQQALQLGVAPAAEVMKDYPDLVPASHALSPDQWESACETAVELFDLAEAITSKAIEQELLVRWIVKHGISEEVASNVIACALAKEHTRLTIDGKPRWVRRYGVDRRLPQWQKYPEVIAEMPWGKTSRAAGISTVEHRKIVSDALAAGMPVPAEVLAEHEALVRPWLETPEDGRPNPAPKRCWELKDPEKEAHAASAPHRPFGRGTAIYGDAEDARRRAKEWNLFITLMLLSDTPLQRACVYGWYGPHRGDQGEAVHWLIHFEGFKPPIHPDFLKAFTEAFDRKPDALAILREALAKGKQVPFVVRDEFPELQIPPYEMTRAEFLEQNRQRAEERGVIGAQATQAARLWRIDADQVVTIGEHEYHVRQALAEGKEVPALVLADYPHLHLEPEPIRLETLPKGKGKTLQLSLPLSL